MQSIPYFVGYLNIWLLGTLSTGHVIYKNSFKIAVETWHTNYIEL